jgi:hypothetical protein
MPTEPTAGRLRRILLAAVPPGRDDIARGMAAEAATLPPGRERRQWLVSSYIYTIKEGRMTWVRLAVSGASSLFILWIAYNAVDSRFTGTGPEIASSIALVLLLATTIVLITPWKQLKAVLGDHSRQPDKPE